MVQDKNQQLFQEFIGKPVKVIIEDLGKPHFLRGILTHVTADFIFVEGDYSRQVIPIKLVLKITQVKGGSEDG